ncbi:hypothetical protein FQA39_LY17104 [Lamprigera yunnana]|nr:hypothetical protein FQA39_LY17104 [Lamprigera yunnana]
MKKKDDANMSLDNQLFNSASDAELHPSDDRPQNESYSFPSTSKNISVYLEEPDKLTRKNKRDIERVSFAVTSKNYQESFERRRALHCMQKIESEEENEAVECNSINRKENVEKMLEKNQQDPIEMGVDELFSMYQSEMKMYYFM